MNLMAASTGSRGGMAAGVLLAGAVALLALPSAVLAFSSGFEPKLVKSANAERDGDFQPSKMSVHLAAVLPPTLLGKGQMFHFTPAGTANRPGRSVTVAVRIDPIAVRGILVRAASPAGIVPGAVPLAIAPTGFNLGVSRGYHSFAQSLVPAGEARKPDAPDLAKIVLAPTRSDDPSRFSPRIVLDQRQEKGSAPRTFAGSEDRVDLGGSYRLGRNLDVTAGVRYSQERDRLRPLTDGKKDNQAVYLGTQFRF